MRSRYSAIASSSFPWSLRAMPRLLWASAIVGLEPQGLAVLGDRLIQLPLVAQGDAEVAVGLGVIGLEPHGFAVLGDRLVHLPLVAAGRLPRLYVGLGDSRA